MGGIFGNFVVMQGIGSVLLLIGFLVATTLLQQRASQQVLDVLDNLPDRVKGTELHQAACRYFLRRNVGNLFTSRAHVIPIWFLIVVVGGCASVCYFGAQMVAGSNVVPSYVLGGILATQPSAGSSLALQHYQSQTVFVGSMAFLAAYVWMIHQLINRINNDDMNPITYYFLSIRLLAACLVGGLSRHVVEAIPFLRDLSTVTIEGVDYPAGLAVLAFLIGWNPTLWIDELLIKVRDLIKTQIPSQRWPDKEKLPNNMSLMLLQGMVPDKVDRLNELNIDNVQKLASENPMVLWARTSYTLDLALDFVGQAQLALLFDEARLKELGTRGIRDIWTYALNIDSAAGITTLSTLLDVPEEFIRSHHRRMGQCPTLARLDELRRALHPVQAAGHPGP